MRKYNRNLISNVIIMGCEGNNTSPDFGEGGSYFDEFAQPDTRTAEDLFPGDFEGGENAGAGSECEIEDGLNSQRRANNLEEIHDPECNPDDADQILDDLNS